NPQIDFEHSPFRVNDRLVDWPSRNGPRRAGVSSLGVGGTNAHVVLEEPPAVSSSEPTRAEQLLVLSAKTPTALESVSQRLADFLDEYADLSLADAAYTLQ